MSDPFAQLFAPADEDGRFYGLAVGIVTNNRDPEGLGRVKVRFPWLSDQDESYWARIATPMAGKNRGLYFLPEVDDEVLVGFERGAMEFPFVLGALWNGRDTPPENNSDGKNNRRIITSRAGHTIRLDDSAGAEKIEIVDRSGKNSIVLDSAQNMLTISADADIVITSANGRLTLSGKGVEIASEMEVTIQAKTTMDLQARASMKIKGATVDIN
jgi:uncharacterized protein involved in type VI secretion and phage assembly